MTFEDLTKNFERYIVARKAAERSESGVQCEVKAHAVKVKRLEKVAKDALTAYVAANVETDAALRSVIAAAVQA
jgi:hypothetical protein